jgi:calcium binding protein 39
MSFLFNRSKQKSPAELVRTLSELLARLDSDKKRANLEEITRNLYQIKVVLHGDHETDPLPDQIALLAQEVYQSEVLVRLIGNLQLLEFDARKDAVTLFTTLLRRQIGNRSPTVDYLMLRPQIFESLIVGNGNPDIALNVGTIIRDSVKDESLAKLVLSSPSFWKFFDYVSDSPFEIATDAFSTISDLLSLHVYVAAEFLCLNSQKFVGKMTTLMSSDNYVTKRQSLKLMAQIISERANFNFMTEYIDSVDNLKLVMVLLRDRSKNIQYEAFHMFKVFVANPKRSKPITDILIKNKQKLLNLLTNFNPERNDNNFFKEELTFIIREISNLPSPSSIASTPSAQASRKASPEAGDLVQPSADTAVPVVPVDREQDDQRWQTSYYSA